MNIWLERFYGRAVRAPEDGSGSGGGETLAGAAAAAAAAAPPADGAVVVGGVKVPSLGEALYGDDAGTKVEENADQRAAAGAQEAAGQVPGDKPKTDEEKAAEATAAAAAAEALKPKAYVDDPNKSADENKAAKEAHDKAEKDRVDALKKEQDEAAKADKRTPEQIEEQAKSYKIDPPEGFQLNEAIDKEFRTIAAKHNWSQEQVDELKAMQIKLYADDAARQAEQVENWGKMVKADKELGGPDHQQKMGVVGRAINEFFPPSTAKLLNKTGLGNEPDFVRGFYRIGLAMGELPTFRNHSSQGGGESIVSRLYGES